MKIKGNLRGSLSKNVFSSEEVSTKHIFRCIAVDEVTRVLKEVHVRDYGEHQGAVDFRSGLFTWIITGPP